MRIATVRCAARCLLFRTNIARRWYSFYFHEMDVSAAASSLGLPEGTVKARLFRGREILRRKLSEKTAVARLREA